MAFLFAQPAPGIVPAGSIDFSELQIVGTNIILGNDGSGTAIEALTPTQVETLLGATDASTASKIVKRDSNSNFDIASVDFDQSPTLSGSNERRLRWNDTDGTLDLGMKGGNVTQQIGEEQYVYGRNNTGSTLLNGKVIRVTGSIGTRVTVALAQADSMANSDGTIGIATEDITNNQEGFVTTFGLVRDIDTSAFSEGAVLYLSAASAGGLTTTAPSSPNVPIRVGTVVKSNPSTGSILVSIQREPNLNALTDVTISSPAANEVLKYNGSGWVNGAAGVSTVGSFSGSAQTNGASISGTTITFGPADATTPGMLSTGAQTISGVKTFSDIIRGPNGTATIPSYSFTNSTSTGMYYDVSYLNLVHGGLTDAGATALKIDIDGNVGINSGSAGSSDGSSRGHLRVTNQVSSVPSFAQSLTVLTPNQSATSDSARGAGIYFGRDESAGGLAHFTFSKNTISKMYMGFWAANDLVTLQSDGKFGIGTTTPAEKLEVVGSILATEFKVTNYKLQPSTHDEGTETGAFTLNWANSPVQEVTLNAAGPLAITLSNPVNGGAYAIRIVQGATPGTVTWPAAVKWPGGTAPTLSTTAGDVDIINLLYFSSTGFYYGTSALDFS